MWTVSQAILLILSSVHAMVTTSEKEHNVTKREIDQQIIGGSSVSMPTAVFIIIKPDENTTQSCSGTILSEDIILSAGHCFDITGSYANATTIVAGVSDLRNYLTGKPHIAQVINVERVTIHPRYRHVDGEPGEKEELVWDLAIIKLSSKMEIETNPNMEAVKLPPPGIRHVGKNVRVGGWGRYKPNSGLSLIHQAIDVMIHPDEKCSDTYDVGEYLPSLMFCAGERDQTTCRGDSGSGALFNWNKNKILIGVLSFGTTGCQTASVFQRVEKSLPWIFRETNLRPAYEVFEDDLLYEEFLDDVDVVAHSPTLKKGVIITGGIGAETSTELFLPHTGKTCSMQSLPDSRWYHSMDTVANKIIMCGGGDVYRTSCLQFLATSSTGSWASYATLAVRRFAHTTHIFQEDILMLGGAGGSLSTGTTEIIGKGRQYNLQQDTYHACSIPDGSSTILTGGESGSGFLKTVARYNMQGFVANLPDLATERRAHGCGYYMDKGNNKVLVVAGGYNGARLLSTELLPPGATAWTSGESLPRAVSNAASVNMDGYLLLIGGWDSSNLRGEVLKFNGTWTEVGMMKNARSSPGATKIEIPGEGDFLDITACY